MSNPLTERNNSLALPLAGDLTVSGVFITPRPLALNDQQLRHHDAKLARSVLPAGMINKPHNGWNIDAR